MSGLVLPGGIGLLALFVGGISDLPSKPATGASEIVVALVFGTLYLGFCWRVIRLGIYVGDQGLCYRGFVRRTVVPWNDVRGVKLAPLDTRLRAFAVVATPPGMAIWIDRVNGPPIQTWVNDRSLDFIGRSRAFQHAFNAIADEVARHAPG